MSTYAKTYALRRVREIALVAEAAPLCMGEIIKVVDGVLGETTELPEWMTLTRTSPEKKSDDLMAEVRGFLRRVERQAYGDGGGEFVEPARALLAKMEGK